ncbi:putative protein YneK [Shigella flexneri]
MEINLSPIYLDNFRHDGEITTLCAPNRKPVTMGRVISDRRPACAISVSDDFIEQFPMINLGVPIKRAHTPHIEPLPPHYHTAADYLRQFDLLVLNFISRGSCHTPRLWNNSRGSQMVRRIKILTYTAISHNRQRIKRGFIAKPDGFIRF